MVLNFSPHSTHSCSFFCHLELKNWKIVVVWHFRVNNSAFFDDDDDSRTCRQVHIVYKIGHILCINFRFREGKVCCMYIVQMCKKTEGENFSGETKDHLNFLPAKSLVLPTFFDFIGNHTWARGDGGGWVGTTPLKTKILANHPPYDVGLRAQGGGKFLAAEGGRNFFHPPWGAIFSEITTPLKKY